MIRYNVLFLCNFIICFITLYFSLKCPTQLFTHSRTITKLNFIVRFTVWFTISKEEEYIYNVFCSLSILRDSLSFAIICYFSLRLFSSKFIFPRLILEQQKHMIYEYINLCHRNIKISRKQYFSKWWYIHSEFNVGLCQKQEKIRKQGRGDRNIL